MAIKVVIFGTASFAELVHAYLSRDAAYEVVAFTVHRDNIKADRFCGLPVIVTTAKSLETTERRRLETQVSKILVKGEVFAG